MEYPNNLFYTKDHEWISFDDQYALIGITDFAQNELGDIVYVDIPTLNSTVHKEDIFGTVEAVKTVSDLFMPVTGKVVAVNPDVEKKPELVNLDPYSTWLIKIFVSTAIEKESLLTAEAYKSLIGANTALNAH
ncbi:glycine cleavage system protein H [Pedobacter sp. PACM 27299]|uniref:glycine cleavage system protein GcvH n=1 Tax=Pedobacter sp. PACM 27299 TaxID=1727164 RepID=UPI00070662BD|nr:glycine cleavage system protein GcvH [Pedobacter sp. PACM 27299]ALL07070.1 glycine cleavage system protein H [Pedobacter sp. PACM 27299]